MAGADLVFKPFARILIAVAEQDGAWGNLSDEIQEVVAIGVGGQIEILYVATLGDLSCARAEHKCLAGFGGFESASRCGGVCVADEEDGLFFVAGHTDGEVVRGGVLAHHAGSDDEDASAGEFHFLHLTGIHHYEVQRFVKLQVGVVAMGAMRFEIVNLREHAAQSADVDGLLLEFALAHEQGEQGQNFLCASEGE